MKLKYPIVSVAVLLIAACSKEQPAEPTPEVPAESGSPVAVEVAGGNPAAEEASRQITADYMRDIIVEISADDYEGRGPGSAGDEKARRYLAERMEEIGLLPGAEDGTWEQPFDLVGINACSK